MKNVLGKCLGDILLVTNEHTSWNQLIIELTSCKTLKYLMDKGVDIYFEYGKDKIYHLNNKTVKQLQKEFQGWCDELGLLLR